MMLPDLITQAFNSLMSQVHVCLPGRIETYDHEKQKARVKPLVKRRLTDGTLEPLPSITSVPVVWPRGGGGELVFPMSAGDGVLLVFAERALENWLREGGDADPVDPRRFDLTDAIAIPGLNPFTTDGASLAENDTDTFLILGDARLQMGPSTGSILQFDTGQFAVNPNGKIAAGQPDGEELLDLLDQLLDALIAATVPTSIGPQQLSTVTDTTVAGIKTALGTIKGSL